MILRTMLFLCWLISMQAAGYIALQDHTWAGSYELGKFDGKYWLSYI